MVINLEGARGIGGARMNQSFNSFNIAILAPHIDDEVIGVGGSIAKHIDLGNKVHIIYINSGSDETEIGIREAEAKTVCSFLNISSYAFLRADIQSLGKNVEREVVKLLRARRTDFLYAPHENDGDLEHIKINGLASRVQWLANKNKNYYVDLAEECDIKGLLFYEVHNPISKVHYFEDISRFSETKKRALELYRSQMEKVDYVKGTIALNEYRGITSELCASAEAFQLLGFKDMFDNFSGFVRR